MRRPEYEPYRFDAFVKLMRKAFHQGCFAGKRELLSISMQGAFEGWSGRASETWEYHFYAVYTDPRSGQQYEGDGRTIQEACEAVLKKIG